MFEETISKGDGAPQAPVQTITKTKIKTGLSMTLAVGVMVVAGSMLLGLFTSHAAVSIFNAAGGRPDNPGGGGGGGGKVKVGLEVSLATLPVAQSVVAGTDNFVFAYIILDATKLTKDVEVRELNFTIITNSQANPAEVHNFRIFDGEGKLDTTNDPDAHASTQVLDGQSAIIKFTIAPTTPLSIVSGTSKVLTVKGDIDNAASDGVYQVGIQKLPRKSKTKVVDAYEVGAKKSINTNYQYSLGPEMTFISSGHLFITQHANTPDAGFIPGNTSGITLATLIAQAQYEDINIENMQITGEVVNSGGWDQIDKVYVYAGSKLVGESTSTPSDGINKTVYIQFYSWRDTPLYPYNSPILVLKDSSVTLTFKADTPKLNYPLYGSGLGLPAAGEGITVKINSAGDVTAKGSQSANSIVPEISYASGNPQYLFRSFPIIATNDLLFDNGVASGVLNGGVESQKNLYRFSVNAHSAGDIGLGGLAFGITIESSQVGDVTISNLCLHDGSECIYTIDDTMMYSNPKVPMYPRYVILGEPSVVDKTFTLKGDVSCINSCSSPGGHGTISIKMLGNSSFPNPLPGNYQDVIVSAGDGFIWTDFWMTPTLKFSDPNALSQSQWSNGFLVPTIDGDTLDATSTSVIFSR